jgi:hypothetical protein
LYTDVGYTLNQTSKYVVLRCFLTQETTDNINRGINIAEYEYSGLAPENSYSPGNFGGCEDYIFPTYKSRNAFEYRTWETYTVEGYKPNFVYLSQSNNVVKINENVIYKFLASPEAAIRNLAEVITENGTPKNRIFQGVNSEINGQVQRVVGVAFMFARQLCSNTSIKIDGYPDLCACIGQGRVSEIRKQLKNSAYRPRCHDGKCIANADNKVFTYIPTLPCSNLSICDINVTLDTPSLKVDKLEIDCKFDKEIYETAQPLPPATALGPKVVSRRYVWFGIACLCFFVLIAALLLK